MFVSLNSGSRRLQTVTFPVYYYCYHRYICMEEKRITRNQLKKVQNTNIETNEEEEGN